MDIYLQKGGQKHGPLSEDQIRRGIDTGVISSDDLACTSDNESWHPLSEILQIDGHRPSSVPGGPHVTKRFLSVPKVLSLPTKIFFGLLFALAGILWIVTLVLEARNAESKAKLKSSLQGMNSNLPQSVTWDGNGKPVWPDFTPSVLPRTNTWRQTPSPTIEEPHVGLLKVESVFVAVYGKSRGSWSESSGRFAGAETVCFANAGMVYFVLFWHGIAHNLYINRIDGKRLTDENIQTALETYADGGTWKSSASTEGRVIEHWERDGAVAELIEYRGDAADVKANRPADVLEIATREYWDEMHRSN